ncbi:MAG TPA: SDR family oxidoreductase [Rhizomicrobium sp.]
MDLGISGRKALVCGSSQGLGFACAAALAREGVQVVINGRDPDKLRDSARTIQEKTGAAVRCVAADQTTEAGRSALIAACPDADILVNNNAGPPPGDPKDWDRDAWIGAFDANMIPAILLIRALLPGMRERKFGRIVNITSAMVKAPHPIMGLSSAARTALTAVCKSISLTVAADNVTINNILPQQMDTPRQEFMAQRRMKEQGITHDEARRQMVAGVAAKRFGLPEEFADACAFLCSAQAGFISGQNLQLDGGSYAGLV